MSTAGRANKGPPCTGYEDHARAYCGNRDRDPALCPPHATARADLADFGLPSSPDHLQAGDAATFRLVQGARRVCQPAVAQGPDSRRRCGVRRQSWRGRRLCRAAAWHVRHDFIPDITSPAKAERIGGYGAQLVSRHAHRRCAGRQRNPRGRTGAMPFILDQAETMLGQGSVGMELEQDAPDSTRC